MKKILSSVLECATHIFVNNLTKVGIYYDAHDRVPNDLLNIASAEVRQEFAKSILKAVGRDQASRVNIVPEWMSLEEGVFVVGEPYDYEEGDPPHHLRFKMNLESADLELLKKAASAVQEDIRSGSIPVKMYKKSYSEIKIEVAGALSVAKLEGGSEGETNAKTTRRRHRHPKQMEFN